MTAAEQRAAVEAHPSMPIESPDARKAYDLREIALWILDNPEQAEYRLSDWWQARLRAVNPRQNEKWNEAFAGRPVYFLGHEIELAAYRLITCACRGDVYEPADMALALRGGSPA